MNPTLAKRNAKRAKRRPRCEPIAAPDPGWSAWAWFNGTAQEPFLRGWHSTHSDGRRAFVGEMMLNAYVCREHAAVMQHAQRTA